MGGFHRRIRQCHQKFFAADPGQQIDVAKIGFQPVGHFYQNGIPGGMTIGVIDGFEPVKIHYHHSKRLARRRGALGDAGHLAASVPVLVGGDWNTPSHLDWTVDTARVYRHRRGAALPVSTAMHDAGFVDAFRAIHPNPVQHPGITWSPLFRVAGDGRAQGFERIDRLYVRNPGPGSPHWELVPRAARVLPEIWEDDAIPVRERQFPSDHGAVLVEFEWVQGGG